MEPILEQIRDFADTAHGDQLRKYTNERYIVHPVRVMETVRGYGGTLPMLAAALLHDVIEDTPTGPKEIEEFLSTLMSPEETAETLKLVIDMTDVYVSAAYPHLNRKQRKKLERERIAETSPDAQTIKYADIIDNAAEIAVQDPNFAPRYLKECLAVLRVADKGNKDLYRRALENVTAHLENLNSAS